MAQKIWHWAQAQNLYLWSAGLGIFGAVDALSPGPLIDHLIGLMIVGVAGWIWLDEGR